MANSRSHTLKDTATVAAAGSSSQANSTVLQRVPTTLIATVSASSRGVRLPSGIVPGHELRLVNETSVNVKVYPATGDKISSAATNAASSVSANKASIFIKGTGNRWNVQAGA